MCVREKFYTTSEKGLERSPGELHISGWRERVVFISCITVVAHFLFVAAPTTSYEPLYIDSSVSELCAPGKITRNIKDTIQFVSSSKSSHIVVVYLCHK